MFYNAAQNTSGTQSAPLDLFRMIDNAQGTTSQFASLSSATNVASAFSSASALLNAIGGWLLLPEKDRLDQKVNPATVSASAASAAAIIAGGAALIGASVGVGVETIVAAAVAGALAGTGVAFVLIGVGLAGYYAYELVQSSASQPVCNTGDVGSCPNPN